MAAMRCKGEGCGAELFHEPQLKDVKGTFDEHKETWDALAGLPRIETDGADYFLTCPKCKKKNVLQVSRAKD